jgi:hypothetical protein
MTAIITQMSRLHGDKPSVISFGTTTDNKHLFLPGVPSIHRIVFPVPRRA